MTNPQARSPLTGIRVLDVSQLIAGPLATAHLADLGADVVKIEPPRGENGREMGNVQLGQHATPAFLAVNCSKRSIVLDLKTVAGREVLARMIPRANALVLNYRPDAAESLGLGYEQICALNPAIVYCLITGYGEHGPLSRQPAVDFALQAQSGLIMINGFPERPVRVGLTVVDVTCAHLVAQGILAALFHQLRCGEGQALTISLYDAAIALQTIPITEFLMTGTQPRRPGNSATLGAPCDLYETADGSLVVAAYFPRQWHTLCELLGRRDLLDDPRYATNADRIANRPALRETLQAAFRQRPSATWLTVLREAGIIVSEVADYERVVTSEQTRANEMLVEWIDPRLGRLRTTAHPMKFSRGPTRERRSMPGLGEHTAEVLAEFGLSPSHIEELHNKGAFGRPTTESDSTTGSR
jgi:crotonobetainyl-CoA:carnitine CoA-transferase CaiB-like acyl-CoA transferase